SSLYDIPLKRIDGTDSRLADFRARVLLVVNVASKCGLTPQYEGLEALYQAKRAEGLEVLGFPANNFKGQEPGDETQIQEFCKLTYDVHCPMFSKVSVLGPDQHPLYAALTEAQPVADGGGLGFGQCRVQRMLVRPKHRNLREHRAVHVVGQLAELLDLRLVTRLLALEVVGRESQHLQALRALGLVQRFEPFVLGRQAALRCHVHNQQHTSAKIREPAVGAVDAFQGNVVQGACHLSSLRECYGFNGADSMQGLDDSCLWASRFPGHAALQRESTTAAPPPLRSP